ncbi:MAG: sigma-70 family RNA polymerase sigma factor [Actinomycetota bacterium]
MTAIRVEDLPGGSREDFDEKKLTVAFKAGDQSAYGSIYARFESRVNHLCRRMLTDRDDAAEATQETFLRVYQSLGRFNGQYKLGAWITRIATNVCLDQLRARQRKPIDATPLEAIEMDPPAGVIEDGPEETFMRLSETRRVRRVLKQLPPMHCAAIVLRDFEGLSYGEIADILEITDCQVKALIHRARQNFKRSWTAGLASLFIPTRLARIRRVDTPIRDQATGAAATHATEVATSAATLVGQCGAAVQTCGQYMTDKAAAIITAAVVGTAAAGGGIIAGANEAKPEHRQEARSQPAAGPASNSVPNQNWAASKGSGSSAAPSAEQDPTGPSETPSEETTDPVAQPDPVPSPTPTETTPGDSGGSAGDTPTEPKPTPTEPPPPPPEPQGFDFSFGSSMPAERGACSCLWATSVDSERVGVSNKGMTSLSQVLTGTASAAGTPSYGLKLSQRSQLGHDHAMQFSLYTEEGSYIYQASGSLTERSRTDWGGWVYSYAGNYRLGGRPTRNEAMPEQGGYTLQLTVSTSRATIVSERFSISP